MTIRHYKWQKCVRQKSIPENSAQKLKQTADGVRSSTILSI